MKNFEIVVKTLKGFESLLAKELNELGATEIVVKNRAVSCMGNQRMLYSINFRSRTALRVLVPICSFKAENPDDVYNELKKIKWEQYLNVNDTFAIDAVVYSELFRHSKYVSYRCKDAIADYFNEKEGKRPSVRISNPKLRLNIHISHTMCTLSLDSSGESLHKRGWRTDTTEAPLSETLAAGLILLSGWDGTSDFYDPMCGSGTLLIEAALIALNISPGIFRKEFAFEKWNDFNAPLLEELYNDESQEREFNHFIYGSDISVQAISTAEKNIKSAGLGKIIKLKQASIDSIKPVTAKGMVITNPPYNERIKVVNMITLYETIGQSLKHNFTGMDAWILAYQKEDQFSIGLKPTGKIALKNGDLDCLFWHYELYSGSKKIKKG